MIALTNMSEKLRKYIATTIAGTLAVGSAIATNTHLQNNTDTINAYVANTLDNIIQYDGKETIIEKYVLSSAIRNAKRGDYKESRALLRDAFVRSRTKSMNLLSAEIGTAISYMEDERGIISTYSSLPDTYFLQEEKQQILADKEFVRIANQTYLKYSEETATASEAVYSNKKTVNSLSEDIQKTGDSIAILASVAVGIILLYGVGAIIKSAVEEFEYKKREFEYKKRKQRLIEEYVKPRAETLASSDRDNEILHINDGTFDMLSFLENRPEEVRLETRPILDKVYFSANKKLKKIKKYVNSGSDKKYQAAWQEVSEAMMPVLVKLPLGVWGRHLKRWKRESEEFYEEIINQHDISRDEAELCKEELVYQLRMSRVYKEIYLIVNQINNEYAEHLLQNTLEERLLVGIDYPQTLQEIKNELRRMKD
jgi:hypothetical protein